MVNDNEILLLVHKAHGNYKIKCGECGELIGDWVGSVPASYLFTMHKEHLKKHQVNFFEETENA